MVLMCLVSAWTCDKIEFMASDSAIVYLDVGDVKMNSSVSKSKFQTSFSGAAELLKL